VQSLVENTTSNGARMSVGQCSECGNHVWKFVSQDDLNVFEKLRDPNTPVDSLREEMRADCGGIGISEQKVGCDWWCANDRILYDWLFYAGHLAEHTIDQHLAAIRFMEDVLQGKPFDNLKIRDVDQVRKALIAALTTKGDAQKSKSTASHHASQIMAFLEWLIKQDGYKRLPRDLPGYIKMPKAVYAKAMPKNDKAYPSIKEAEMLLMSMPSLTNADKRARAMFASAYLGVLRADTVTSLQVCHFDTDNRQIIQDATLSRTKNGKSLRITWFPIPESFVEAVLDWVEFVTKSGLRDDDALFPSLRTLQARKDLKDPNRDPVEPMVTTDAVTKAFALACRDAEVKYNPHSVKDTLAIERERLQLTGLQRKAWSENMGHEDEKTTNIYYGKLPEAERFALFEEIKCGMNGSEITLDSIRNEDKITIFDGVAACIMNLTGGDR
jgi:integrase